MKVGIFMGSKSDLDTVSAAFGILDEFGIEYEYNILSAHRTPAQVINKITELEEKGAKVFIGAAGMAAHLSGVIAAILINLFWESPWAVEPWGAWILYYLQFKCQRESLWQLLQLANLEQSMPQFLPCKFFHHQTMS